MRTKFFTTAVALLLSGSMMARNEIKTVAQVNESVDIDTPIDYVISGNTPFGAMGSVNITSTEHAVVIIEKVRPSDVLNDLMGNIFINGEAAVDGTNCQVRMFNRGAIILPYDKNIKPLTCYTENDFGGDSYNGYTEGSSGGFMKNLNNTSLNNKIKSFKLKRGYMVTFATGTEGWGYSRCFIADLEDLEINVPAPLNGKASSYRLFKWWNSSKAGGASSGDKNFNRAIRSTWCYDWAQGNASLLPDQEWVPNHIYEDWPSASSCGSVTGACHMKTNNEPANSADDHPQDVATVLNNWQNLMRTGLRLCSPATHDGGWGWHDDFMKAIDERGWRCDLVDFHGYWDGEWGSLDWRIDRYAYGRPVWFSEWLWGASWNKNGIFKAVSNPDDYSTSNQQTMYNGTKPILDKLNSNARVERYAIWNGERNASKIYKDGALSILGNYYATMETGLAYRASNEFVPKIVYTAPSELTSEFNKKTSTIEVTWSDPNGDMIDSCVLEVKRPNAIRWTAVSTIAPKDVNSKNGITYTVKDNPEEAGLHTYRIVEYVNGSKKFTTNEVSATISAAHAVGRLQYGQMKIGDNEVVTTDIEAQEVAPYAVMGMVSNKNSGNGLANQITSLTKTSFKFRLNPWTLDAPVEMKNAESIDYLVLPADTVIHIGDDFMLISQKFGYVKGDELEVVFPEAFPEGVIPVVVAQQNYTSTTAAPTTVKFYDITNIGFKVKLVRQQGITTNLQQQNVNYFAATPGQVSVGGGKMLTVGRNNETKVGGLSTITVSLTDATGEAVSLENPFIIAAPQTNNYAKASIFRMPSTSSDENGVNAIKVRRQVDSSSTVTESNKADTNGDYVGWFIISNDPNGNPEDKPVIDDPNITGISTAKAELGFTVSSADGMIIAEGKNLKAFNANGQQVALGKKVPAGIYIVTNGKQSAKVVVR